MVSDLKNTTLLEVDQGWYHEFLQQLTTTRWLTSHFSLQHQCITRIAIINRTTLSWSNTRNKKNTRERKLEYRNLSKSVRKIRVDLLLDPFPFSSFDSQKRWHYISRIKWFIVFYSLTLNKVETVSQLDFELVLVCYRFSVGCYFRHWGSTRLNWVHSEESIKKCKTWLCQNNDIFDETKNTECWLPISGVIYLLL